MTDLDTLLRETLHSRADRAPLEHRLVHAATSAGPRAPRPRARRLAGGVTLAGLAATAVVALTVTQHSDEPAGSGYATQPVQSEPAPAGGATAQDAYADAATRSIVDCLQGAGFAVVMDDESQVNDAAGRPQLTFRVPRAVRKDPAYRAANATCVAEAEAAVPSRGVGVGGSR